MFEVHDGVCIFNEGVEEIWSRQIQGRSDIIEVKLPESVTYIGESAFSRCTSLKKIILPDSIEYIGKDAFQWCENLEEIILPSKIKI